MTLMNPIPFLLLAFFVSLVGTLQAQTSDQAEVGFELLFNGTDLEGWDGDPRFWRVEDQVVIGETTQENKAENNTFLIYGEREFANFELRFSFQVKGYNSGVQYRSVDQGNWVVAGYQADFEDRWHKEGDTTVDKFSGMFFDEKGRMFMGQRGEAVIVRENAENPKKPVIEKIATLGDPQELANLIRRDGWNDYTIIANGNQFIHIINHRVMAIGIDEDTKGGRSTGILAFQLHKGPPMKIQIKNLRIRDLNQE